MSKKRHLLDRKSESSKQVFGVVKRSFPLQSLSENDTGMKEFGPGIGPCGLDATKLVVLEVENHILF
jgi:hypothetical protein